MEKITDHVDATSKKWIHTGQVLTSFREVCLEEMYSTEEQIKNKHEIQKQNLKKVTIYNF